MALLSGLVAARLCHDLAGPLGAIANGVDLIGELGDQVTADDLSLVTQSTGRCAALMKGLRLAFGDAAPDGHPRARSEILETLQPLIAGRRVHLSCIGLDGPPLPPPAARLSALMIFSARLLLGLEGAIEVVFSPETALPIRVVARGPRAGVTVERAAWIAGNFDVQPSSREIELALLGAVAAHAGGRVSAEDDDGTVSLIACPARG